MQIPIKDETSNPLLEELAALEAQDEEKRECRSDELYWIADQLCEMSDENFREFVRYVKYLRKAESHRRRLSPNA